MHIDELAAPRGRFLLAEAVKGSSFNKGRLVYQFDELNPDVIHNRILKAALVTLMRSEAIEASLVAELNDLRAKLGGVTEIPLSKHLFKQLQLSRNIRQYGLLMKIREMLCDLLLPEERGRNSRFADILQDEERMSAIFEAFIRNFYRREQTLFSVGSEVIPWDMGPAPSGHTAYLPAMLTDITRRSPIRTVVIDAKFYRQTLVSYWGGQSKVRSAHLYQLMSYLMNTAKRGGPDAYAEGLLL
jgi:5-methylcytosine-specific restriction enzyme subunit McrC